MILAFAIGAIVFVVVFVVYGVNAAWDDRRRPRPSPHRRDVYWPRYWKSLGR